jgi:hypothetical protein
MMMEVSDHVAPPAVADVAFELHAERAVVEETVEPAVDFGRLVDEAAALRERHEGFHEIRVFGGGSGHGGKERPQLDVGSSWPAKRVPRGRSRLGAQVPPTWSTNGAHHPAKRSSQKITKETKNAESAG